MIKGISQIKELLGIMLIFGLGTFASQDFLSGLAMSK
jgi:hypothetical protein